VTGQRNTRAGRVADVDRLLAAAFPVATTELDFRNPFELLVATILSAQCTDVRVNQVTPGLFRRYPDAAALAPADQAELEGLIRSTGFFRSKAKSLLGMACALVEHHGGSVPADMEALTALPGVGRKTANVVLGIAFGIPSGIVVDTHVARVSRRLGLTSEESPEAVEVELMKGIPRTSWVEFGSRMILHGRRVCRAHKPACESCVLTEVCPRIGV
jgi:endonuclease III